MASAQLAHIVAEALDGRRRLFQLETWFDETSLTVLGGGQHRLSGQPVRLASVHVQPRTPGSAEVTLRLVTPSLSHAAALRVSRYGQTWVGSGLVLG